MIKNISRIGVYNIAQCFERIGFAFRELSVEDYGIDAIIEERTANYLSGKLVAVQIKSGKSYFLEQNEKKIIFRIDDVHYNYWVNYCLPVIVVLYSEENNEIYFNIVKYENLINTGKNWKLEIDKNCRLENGKEMLHDLCDKQNKYQERMNTLVLSKDLMKLAIDEKLILEVEEWINKSSGRGSFILKQINNDGKEIEIIRKEIIGFGLKDYSLAIQELFPWAEIEIDYDYYEMYGDEEYIDTFVNNREIYPYKNGACEVDFYRLKLSLNEIGKSFMLLDSFLNNGKMYNIVFR